MNIDLENMLKTFDEVLLSEDPQVKQALNTLVMMVALTRDPDGDTDGPLLHMWRSFDNSRRQMDDLQRQVEKLQNEVDLLKTNPADDSYSWKRWGNDIKGTSVNEIWVDEMVTALPGQAWNTVMKKAKK